MLVWEAMAREVQKPARADVFALLEALVNFQSLVHQIILHKIINLKVLEPIFYWKPIKEDRADDSFSDWALHSLSLDLQVASCSKDSMSSVFPIIGQSVVVHIFHTQP